MAGKICPKCGKATLFESPTGRKCTNPECGYKVDVPPNGGVGGKGKKCPICGKFTMFNGKCTNCGAKESG